MAIVATSVLLAAAFWTRNIFAIALIIPIGIYLATNRATTKAERERRESLSFRSLAVSLFIPTIIIFIAAIYFIGKIVPKIIKHWQ